MIGITRHQGVLGDDANRLTTVGGHGKTLPGDLKLLLDWLVWIGDARQRDPLWFPLRSCKPATEQVGRFGLEEDLGFEIDASAETKVFVRRSGVAVAATMETTAVRIQAVIK